MSELNTWGTKQDNGSWSGIIGEHFNHSFLFSRDCQVHLDQSLGALARNDYDIAITGFTVSKERNEVVDFLDLAINVFQRALVIRRPQSETVSWQNYLYVRVHLHG